MTAPALVAGETGWERLLPNATRPASVDPAYQELKFTLHRKLLDRINLEALAGVESRVAQSVSWLKV